MNGWTLRTKQEPSLRVDLRGVTPTALGALAKQQVEQFPVAYGNARVPLAEFFHVEPGVDDALIFTADLARFDRVGWQMGCGRLVVDGSVGDYAGGCMSGGELVVQGHAGALVACEMSGGTVTIGGDAGDFAASTLPGSMDGMRGGTLVIRGNTGARFGDRMRRGTAVVFGDAGDFIASRLVAGTIAIGGRIGAHPGFGMRRGSVVLATAEPACSPTFVATVADVPVFWQLLARDLARHGGVFTDLPARRIQRRLGDLAADGKGELILVR